MSNEPDGPGRNPLSRASDVPSPGDVNDLNRREFIAMTSVALVAASAGGSAVAQNSDRQAGVNAARPVDEVAIALQVNGKTYELQIEPRVTLLDALRNYIGLTGTKKGCDHGQCGACTVLVNRRRIYSCLNLAVMHTDVPIVTVEGLANGDELSPLQAEFIAHDAFQCGYCTPGQICSATGLLQEGHAETDAQVRELMSGNLCRCGAYNNIVRAIQAAKSHVPAAK